MLPGEEVADGVAEAVAVPGGGSVVDMVGGLGEALLCHVEKRMREN